ncbi:unnamed protein product [Clonostachys byssicola]|uniref:Cytochrome P450 n=1 Tax=Clonostachys byssicola TaxID=160290 RepID=A0A9N9U3M9_9HYPO|nr:unnamed protein product [Clonostachys byssicola]
MFLAQVADALHVHHFALLLVVSAVAAILYRHLQPRPFPIHIPLIREKPDAQHFSIWTRIAFHLNCSSLYSEIWHKFSKKGKAVAVPTLGLRNEVFLPHSSLPWALSQPLRVLGMWEAFNEHFQLVHSLGDEKYMTDTWPHLLSRHTLTHEMDDHLMDIHEEVKVAIDTYLGHDTENWKTLNLLQTVRMIIAQTGTRFTLGMPFCRDQSYLHTIKDTVDSIVINAGATGFFPAPIRSFLGPIICWPTHRKIDHLAKKFYDMEFKSRLQDISSDNPDQKLDLVQKMLRHARKHRPEELAVDQMTRRVCMSNLAFIYLASFTTTNLFSNLLASDPQYDTVAVLREEAAQFLATEPDPRKLWRRENTNRLVHADSLMKETLRLNSVPTRALARQVMVDGVVTDAGVPLPKGTIISFVAQPMHTDPDQYVNPLHLDPFRFNRLREEETSKETDGPAREVGGEGDPNSFLSTAKLLAFGRGKNSCPGRYLMDYQMKMLLAYLVLNYDVKLADEHKNQRPPSRWILEFMFPSGETKFQFKRRKNAPNWGAKSEK